MDPQQIQTFLQEYVDALGASSGGIFLRLLETLAALLLIVVLQQLAYRLINKSIIDVERRHQMRVWARLVALTFMILLLIALWLPSGQTLLQVLALLAAGLALTLSRPITNLLAWSVIMLRTPFRVGDRIQTGEVKGDVVDIGLLHVHLLELGNWVDADQATGRIVHVPNSVIFDGPVYNYTEGFDLIWNEIEFVVTHDSDWERAREILLELALVYHEEVEPHAIKAADRMARRYAYQRGITTPFVYVRLLRDGLKLALRHLVPPRRRRGATHDLTTAFLHRLAEEPGIRLAAPAYRVLMEPEMPPAARRESPWEAGGKGE